MGRRGIFTGFALVALAAAPAHALVWPDVPERIERRLQTGDPTARRAAAHDLVSLGPERAAPLALAALQDPDDEVKIAAADSAIRLRLSGVTPAVLAWFGAPAPALRLEACEVARALPDPRAVPALARALADAEATVRQKAAEALASYTGNADAVPPLLGRLDDPSPVVRGVVARSLGRLLDPRAVVPLVGKVQDSVPDVRQQVARALGDLGDPRAVQALLVALRDNVVEVRVEALAALGKLRAEDAVLGVAPLAFDRSTQVRQAAIAALGRIGSAAAVRALTGALGAGDDAAALFEHTAVRDALVAAGQAAVPALTAVLERSPNAQAAASAAWVLGELHARASAPLVVAAMRRGSLPVPAALHALAGVGSADSLPVVLEFASDPSPVVHEQALAAAAALLDPAKPDGRAAEPLAAALHDPRLSAGDQAAIARLLGRTGAARAAPVLADLARSKGSVVRLAAIDAIGTLGPVAATQGDALAPLLDALADADAAVRLHAAVSIGDAGDSRARDTLLAKLDDEEIDRTTVLVALGGVLARAPSEAALARLRRELDLAAGAARDAVAEALGRARAPAALDALQSLATGPSADDARTAATLLACHAGDARARGIARGLLLHHDPSVRAQAAWALGALGDASSADALTPLLAGELDEAIDAAGAVGRIGARLGSPGVAAHLCAAVSDHRAYVRASALAGLSLARARCGDGALERRALSDDPSEAARAAAALAVGRAPLGDADTRALARCAAEDRAGDVASRCRALPALPAKTRAVSVYVVPDLGVAPTANAPYVIVLSDGSLHAGTADRRGAVFDPAVPEGDLTLLRSNER